MSGLQDPAIIPGWTTSVVDSMEIAKGLLVFGQGGDNVGAKG